MHPHAVSPLFHCTPSLAKDLLPVYSLFTTLSFVFSFFFYPCALLFLITLTHFKVLHPPRSLLFLDTPILHGFLFRSHLFPSLLSLIFCLSISSLIFFPPSISFSTYPRHPIVWKPAHPGPAPEALCTAPWVMGIVYSHWSLTGPYCASAGCQKHKSQPACHIVSHSKWRSSSSGSQHSLEMSKEREVV